MYTTVCTSGFAPERTVSDSSDLLVTLRKEILSSFRGRLRLPLPLSLACLRTVFFVAIAVPPLPLPRHECHRPRRTAALIRDLDRQRNVERAARRQLAEADQHLFPTHPQLQPSHVCRLPAV